MRLKKIITPRILNNYSTNPNLNICVLFFFFFLFHKFKSYNGKSGFEVFNSRHLHWKHEEVSIELRGFWHAWVLLKNKKILKLPLLGPPKKKNSKKSYPIFPNFFYSSLNFLSNQIERGNTVAALFSERKPRFLSSP